MAESLDPTIYDPNLYYSTPSEAVVSGYSSPIEEKFFEWAQDPANLGKIFDWYAETGIPTQKGISSVVTGFNEAGKPIIQTLQSEERTNWMETAGSARGATSLEEAVDMIVQRLMAVGYDKQMATYLAYNRLEGNSYGSRGFASTTSTTKNAFTPSTASTATINKINVKTWEQEQAELDEKRRTENAISTMTELFSRYGLSSLVPKMRELAISGASEATITLQLSETDEWKQRFKANEERKKKGLAVLLPGEYIGLEDKYRQILRAYGLKRFDNDDYVSQFLANDISPTELNSRVQLASQRVEAADPLVTSTLRRFYNINNTDLVAYMLNPDEELPKLERQVTAAEIGAKMLGQGIAANLTGKTFTGAEGAAFTNVQRGTIGVEAMMQAGATAEEAARVSKYIASVLPRAEFLSSIYGPSGYQQYGQLQAEQEGFQGLASAERARQQLIGREFAEFRGSSGISKAAFGSQSQGQF